MGYFGHQHIYFVAQPQSVVKRFSVSKAHVCDVLLTTTSRKCIQKMYLKFYTAQKLSSRARLSYAVLQVFSSVCVFMYDKMQKPDIMCWCVWMYDIQYFDRQCTTLHLLWGLGYLVILVCDESGDPLLVYDKLIDSEPPRLGPTSPIRAHLPD